MSGSKYFNGFAFGLSSTGLPRLVLDVFEFLRFGWFFPIFKKIGFWGILGPPSYGIRASICIGREMLCLPYAGFFFLNLYMCILKTFNWKLSWRVFKSCYWEIICVDTAFELNFLFHLQAHQTKDTKLSFKYFGWLLTFRFFCLFETWSQRKYLFKVSFPSGFQAFGRRHRLDLLFSIYRAKTISQTINALLSFEMLPNYAQDYVH